MYGVLCGLLSGAVQCSAVPREGRVAAGVGGV